MKSDNLKDILRKSNQGLTEKSGYVKVLVALKSSKPDQASLDRLRALGLSIDRVVRNKVIGSIAADRLNALKKDPQVAEAELSVRLGPHT